MQYFYLYYQQISTLFSAHFFMLNHSFLTTFQPAFAGSIV